VCFAGGALPRKSCCESVATETERCVLEIVADAECGSVVARMKLAFTQGSVRACVAR